MPEISSFQPARLDVDPTILDSNLMFVSNPEAEQLNSLFPSLGPSTPSPLSSLMPEDDFPSSTVIPKPGLCIKTKNNAGAKFFINMCKLAEIPPPPPMEESELTRMIETEDYTSLWRVPMSLGAPRQEKEDKSGTDGGGGCCEHCLVLWNHGGQPGLYLLWGDHEHGHGG